MAFDVGAAQRGLRRRSATTAGGGGADRRGSRVFSGCGSQVGGGGAASSRILTRPTHAAFGMELLDDVILMLRRAAPAGDRRGQRAPPSVVGCAWHWLQTFG